MGGESVLDVKHLRADTPAAAQRLHLDNCGSSLMPKPVMDALQHHLALEAAVGGYVAQERRAEALEGFYVSMARLLGGSAADYAFTASAVDAWVRAFYSVPMQDGDNIVTAFNEYCANYVAYLHQARRRGVEIRTVGPAEDGTLDIAALAACVDTRTRLISLSHVPSSSGQINDVVAVGQVAAETGVPYLLDACQSIGQLPVRVEEIGCHMLTGTGRKFLRGPRGTGFLYMNADMRARIDPVVLTNASAHWSGPESYDLRDDTRLFEGWEKNIAGQLGLSAAVDYFLGLGVGAAVARTRALAERLRAGLASLPHVTMTCPAGAEAAIITFNVAGFDAVTLKGALEAEEIAVQVARAEHTRLDLGPRGIETTVRVSPHYYNLENEIDQFIERIEAFA